MKIAQRFIAGIRTGTADRVPEGRMSIGVSSTIFPSHEWLGYFHVLLTEQLQNQVLCFDRVVKYPGGGDKVTSDK